MCRGHLPSAVGEAEEEVGPPRLAVSPLLCPLPCFRLLLHRHSLGSYCGPGLCQDSGLGDLPQGRFLFGRRSVTPESSLPPLCPACKRDQTGLWPRVRDPTLLGPWELRSQASPGTHRRWLGTAVIRGPEGSLPSHSSTQEEGALPPASHLHPVGEGSLLGGERGVETAAFLNRPALVSIPAL